jgi:hypothetical protein
MSYRRYVKRKVEENMTKFSPVDPSIHPAEVTTSDVSYRILPDEHDGAKFHYKPFHELPKDSFIDDDSSVSD